MRAWALWQRLDYFSRPRGWGPAPLPLDVVWRACWAEDETEAVYFWILEIERLVFTERLQATSSSSNDHGELSTPTER